MSLLYIGKRYEVVAIDELFSCYIAFWINSFPFHDFWGGRNDTNKKINRNVNQNDTHVAHSMQLPSPNLIIILLLILLLNDIQNYITWALLDNNTQKHLLSSNFTCMLKSIRYYSVCSSSLSLSYVEKNKRTRKQQG